MISSLFNFLWHLLTSNNQSDCLNLRHPVSFIYIELRNVIQKAVYISNKISTIFLEYYSRLSNLGRLRDSPAIAVLVMGVLVAVGGPIFRHTSKIKQDFQNDSLLTFETPQILWQGCYNKFISKEQINGGKRHSKSSDGSLSLNGCVTIYSQETQEFFLYTMRYFQSTFGV